MIIGALTSRLGIGVTPISLNLSRSLPDTVPQWLTTVAGSGGGTLTVNALTSSSRLYVWREGLTSTMKAGREPMPCAVLCDGAGNAQLAPKRVLNLFDKLFKETTRNQVCNPTIWHRWAKLLDSALLGGNQTTFLAVAVLDGGAVGASAGDSRAYYLDRNGECRILTEGANKDRLGCG